MLTNENLELAESPLLLVPEPNIDVAAVDVVSLPVPNEMHLGTTPIFLLRKPNAEVASLGSAASVFTSEANADKPVFFENKFCVEETKSLLVIAELLVLSVVEIVFDLVFINENVEEAAVVCGIDPSLFETVVGNNFVL